MERRNSLCFLCFKPAAPKQKENNGNCLETKFLLLLSRHFKTHLKLENVSAEFLWCEDCSTLGKSFCDLFFQLECVQLQLSWKLKRICETMVCAGRVSSRVNAFRTQFQKGGEEKDADDGTEGQRIFSQIQKTRRNLIKQCKLRLKSNLPMVRLKRISDQVENQREVDTKTKITSPKKSTVAPSCELDKFELVAALLTFVAVLHLSLPWHSTHLPTVCHADFDNMMDMEDDDDDNYCADANDELEVANDAGQGRIQPPQDISSEMDVEAEEEGRPNVSDETNDAAGVNVILPSYSTTANEYSSPNSANSPLATEEELASSSSTKLLRSLLKCQMCSETFTNQEALNLHLYQHEPTPVLHAKPSDINSPIIENEAHIDIDFKEELDDDDPDHLDEEMIIECSNENDQLASSSSTEFELIEAENKNSTNQNNENDADEAAQNATASTNDDGTGFDEENACLLHYFITS